MSDQPGRLPAALVAEDLEVRYQGGPEPALRGVSVAVPAGEGLVVTGPEGCGKTSLVRAMVGLVAPTAGRVSVLGGDPADPAVRRRVGYGPERHPFPRVMRTGEALGLVAAVRGVHPGVIPATMARVGMPPQPGRRIDTLEVEEIRRLCLACAVLGDPEVLVLDDPWEFPETVEVLADAVRRGATVLLATPDPGGFPALLGRTITLEAGVRV